MQMRVPPHTVNPDDPFGGDLLDRKPTAEALTELARRSTSGLTISLGAPWGSGKTTFLQMWKSHLGREGFNVVYFNAWENDYVEDVLAALVAELRSQIEALASADDGKLKSGFKSVMRFAGQVSKQLLPGAVKAVTCGALDLGATAEVLGDAAQNYVEKQIRAYEAMRDSIGKFRASIRDFSLAASKARGNSYPLVVIVDELDRCRPSHAVRVLECMKHLFAVENVFFVVAVDRDQLAASVASEYGELVDRPGYFRRLFDLELALPRSSPAQYSEMLWQRFSIEENLNRRATSTLGEFEEKHTRALLDALLERFGCSLRDYDRAFAQLSLLLQTTEDREPALSLIGSILIVLKLKAPEQFRGLVERRIAPRDLVDFILERQSATQLRTAILMDIVEISLRVAGSDSESASQFAEGLVNSANRSTTNDGSLRRAKIAHGFQQSSLAGKLFTHVLPRVELVSALQPIEQAPNTSSSFELPTPPATRATACAPP